MLVVSWNIEFGRRAESAAELLATAPELAHADIVLLQEMDEPGTRRIAERLEANWRYAEASVHPKSGRPFGNAVLARHEVGDRYVVRLPHMSRVAGQPRLALVVPVVVGATNVLAASVHTEVASLGAARRRAQFRGIVDGVRGAVGTVPYPTVVGGDFNTLTSVGRRRLRREMAGFELELLSAGIGPTLSRGGKGFQLDHVFGRGVRVRASGRVDGSLASDHDPIWVKLALETDVIVDDDVPRHGMDNGNEYRHD